MSINIPLTGSVGTAGQNRPQDVLTIKRRLTELGFDWLSITSTVDSGLVSTIRLFQSIIQGHTKVIGDGRIDVNGLTHTWLQAANTPNWQQMPASAPAQGFRNFELEDTADTHDYGVNWLADSLLNAAQVYHNDYLVSHPHAALLTLNDTSLPRGGDTPNHAGHETGIASDLRLPHKDGTSGGITYENADYDRMAARAMIIALRNQPLAHIIFFNDKVLIAENLCSPLIGHNDHFHFQIDPPMKQ